MNTAFNPFLSLFIRTLLAEDGNQSSELRALKRPSEPDTKSRKAAQYRIEVLSRLLRYLLQPVTRK